MFPCLGLQSAETRVDEASNVPLMFEIRHSVRRHQLSADVLGVTPQ